MAKPDKSFAPTTAAAAVHETFGPDMNAEVARLVYDGFNARQFDRCLALCTDDVEITIVPFDQTFTGRKGFRDFLQGWADAMPDCRVHLQRQYPTENSVTNEFRGTGTHTGTLQGPAGPVGPTNKRIDVQFCEVWDMHDGKLKNLRLYFDAATMLRQLGLGK